MAGNSQSASGFERWNKERNSRAPHVLSLGEPRLNIGLGLTSHGRGNYHGDGSSHSHDTTHCWHALEKKINRAERLIQNQLFD